jgi:hypothetical protein
MEIRNRHEVTVFTSNLGPLPGYTTALRCRGECYENLQVLYPETV